jgi:hypothetical protein
MDEMQVPSIDQEELEKLLRNDFQNCIAEVTEAVNKARTGAIIDDSEEPVRMATARLRQMIFQKAIQMKTDAAEAAFSPQKNKAGQRLRHKGRQAVSRDTVNGNIRVKRIRWWSNDYGCDDTIDQVLGIVADQVSVGVRQMCSRVAISQQGFRKAAKHLDHLAQIKISHERLRTIVEQEGQKLLQAQSKGQIETSVTPEKCKTAPDGPTRVYIGTDGVKVPMVTTEEKLKRRRKRGPKRKGSRRRVMRPGADNSYKEFKIATFYDQSNEHRHVIATAGDHEVLGRLVRRQAIRLGLNQFDQRLAIADGADWIHNQLTDKIPTLNEFILDFYHFSEHIWLVSNTCFGVGSQEAASFASELLHLAKHQGATEILLILASKRKTLRSASKREALEQLIGYISKRIGQCDYPRYVSEGWQIGSGPTEAMCKVLTYRLKGSGMRWDRQGAEPIMALIALEQSNAWESYWQSQNLAA